MRTGMMVGCGVLWWSVAVCPADEPLPGSSKAEPVRPVVKTVLREACDIILKQPEHQHYWTERALLQLTDVQIRAGDLEGALRSIRGAGCSYGLIHVAEEFVGRGNRERADDVLRLLGADEDLKREGKDRVQVRWIEHLITSGDIGRAHKAAEERKSSRYRHEVLRRLAVAYARSGDTARAAEQFTRAIDAASALKDELARTGAHVEIAEARLAVGEAGAAKEMIRRLVEEVRWKDARAKVTALRQSAILAAKAKDEPAAHRLFRQAVKAVKALSWGHNEELHAIAVAQAGFGYLDDALKTASMIEESERGDALHEIAMAQLKANDPEGAVRTALRFLQYRDDALHRIVEHHIAKRNLKSALAVVDLFDNPSQRAAATLKVATGYAKAGDRKTAAEVAAGIDLTHQDRDRFVGSLRNEFFHYRLPASWGVRYDAGPAFTISSSISATERAVEVASSAMELSQALGQRPPTSYAVLFTDVGPTIIEALARAHALSGDPSEALAWAERIGLNCKVKSKEDWDTLFAVEQRIFALIGLAEGLLDRSDALGPPAR
jgi:tetratricopeptide (TPR) repeat protein